MAKKGLTYRLVAIICIVFALAAPLIYALHFYAGRMVHRIEMWSLVKDQKLQQLELDSATIKWTKKNRELIVNGAYFDIATITYKDGIAFITGIFDDEETEMHEAFAKAQSPNDIPGHTTKKMANWLQKQWHEGNAYWHVEATPPHLITHLYPSADHVAIHLKPDPPSPPPKS